MTKTKLTEGLNDRAKNETIAQTGAGLPDDTSRPPELDEEEAKRIEQKIRQMGAGSAESRLKSEVQDEIDLPLKGSA
ncbi:MAG TPA: hypothetical protein VGB81_16825 [Devosia sp.]